MTLSYNDFYFLGFGNFSRFSIDFQSSALSGPASIALRACVQIGRSGGSKTQVCQISGLSSVANLRNCRSLETTCCYGSFSSHRKRERVHEQNFAPFWRSSSALRRARSKRRDAAVAAAAAAGPCNRPASRRRRSYSEPSTIGEPSDQFLRWTRTKGRRSCRWKRRRRRTRKKETKKTVRLAKSEFALVALLKQIWSGHARIVPSAAKFIITLLCADGNTAQSG